MPSYFFTCCCGVRPSVSSVVFRRCSPSLGVAMATATDAIAADLACDVARVANLDDVVPLSPPVTQSPLPHVIFPFVLVLPAPKNRIVVVGKFELLSVVCGGAEAVSCETFSSSLLASSALLSTITIGVGASETTTSAAIPLFSSCLAFETAGV